MDIRHNELVSSTIAYAGVIRIDSAVGKAIARERSWVQIPLHPSSLQHLEANVQQPYLYIDIPHMWLNS